VPSLRESGSTLFGDLRRAAGILGGVVAVLWLVLLINTLFFAGRLDRFGIEPRTLSGLRGIVFAPFLHAGIAHVSANSVGLLLLGGLVLLRNEIDFWVVALVGVVVGGACTWLFGRPLMHIGASGIIFAYFGYLLCTGLFERRIGAMMLSVIAVLGWGGLIYGVLPNQPGISWESHLFGLAGGAYAALLLARHRRNPPQKSATTQ